MEDDFMSEEEVKISPALLAYPDENHDNLIIEIELPRVKKENVKVKIHEDSFYITATKEGTQYIGSYAVCCPVVPEKAKATYENGLLRVAVPYKDPLEDAVDVMVE
jgi:HSP20 family molecular chaperone IbpA